MREIGIDDYVAMVLRPGRDQMARRARAALIDRCVREEIAAMRVCALRPLALADFDPPGDVFAYLVRRRFRRYARENTA